MELCRFGILLKGANISGNDRTWLVKKQIQLFCVLVYFSVLKNAFFEMSGSYFILFYNTLLRLALAILRSPFWRLDI